MKLRKNIVFGFVVFGVIAQASEYQHLCRKDIRRYCKNITPGEGRIEQCLIENLSRLTYQCRFLSKSLLELSDVDRVRFRVCKSDIQEYCRNIPNESFQLRNCLVNNADRLSQLCVRGTFWRAIQRRQRRPLSVRRKQSVLGRRAKKMCEPDIKRFCPQKKPKKGVLYQCLRRHQIELSRTCRRAVPEFTKNTVQLSPYQRQVSVFCAEDRATHCSRLKPGDRSLLACLRRNKSRLKASCLEVLNQETKPSTLGRSLQRICQSDIEQFCRHIAPGSGRLRQCLLSRPNEVSELCLRHLKR